MQKYSRQLICRYIIKKDIGGEILCQRSDWGKVEILELETYSDHISILLSIPVDLNSSRFTGYLKGESSLMIFARMSYVREAGMNIPNNKQREKACAQKIWLL